MADLCVPSDYGLPEMADLDHSYGSRHLEVARRPIRPLLRPGSRWRPLRPDEEDLLPVEEKISASIHHSCLLVVLLKIMMKAETPRRTRWNYLTSIVHSIIK